jgi:hypothetical protein
VGHCLTILKFIRSRYNDRNASRDPKSPLNHTYHRDPEKLHPNIRACAGLRPSRDPLEVLKRQRLEGIVALLSDGFRQRLLPLSLQAPVKPRAEADSGRQWKAHANII